MKHVLLWVILSANGAISSSSAEFETSKACQAGRNAMEEVLTNSARRAGQKQPEISTLCVDASTGDRENRRY
jgi:hypothetical protein